MSRSKWHTYNINYGRASLKLLQNEIAPLSSLMGIIFCLNLTGGKYIWKYDKLWASKEWCRVDYQEATLRVSEHSCLRGMPLAITARHPHDRHHKVPPQTGCFWYDTDPSSFLGFFCSCLILQNRSFSFSSLKSSFSFATIFESSNFWIFWATKIPSASLVFISLNRTLDE